jgi:hypothetical protein
MSDNPKKPFKYPAKHSLFGIPTAACPHNSQSELGVNPKGEQIRSYNDLRVGPPDPTATLDESEFQGPPTPGTSTPAVAIGVTEQGNCPENVDHTRGEGEPGVASRGAY